MEYYSAMQKCEIMTFAAAWIDLEKIILSDPLPCESYRKKKRIEMNLRAEQK